MNKYLTIGLTIAAALLLSACAQSAKAKTPEATAATEAMGATEAAMAADTAYHKISAEEAKKMMDGGNVTVVDVRREDEYKEAHIPGAILVSNESIGEEQPEALPDKDATLLVHCRTGIRSKQASDKLVKMGYKNVYDFGGIADWPYETESGDAK